MCIHGVCKVSCDDEIEVNSSLFSSMIQEVSCDWVIGGTAKEDRCGLCHGDGTQCITTKGVFDRKTDVSYVQVTTFPKGSRNIRVKEHSDASNYFAIRDSETGKYYLNGNWFVSSKHKQGEENHDK